VLKCERRGSARMLPGLWLKTDYKVGAPAAGRVLTSICDIDPTSLDIAKGLSERSLERAVADLTAAKNRRPNDTALRA
jgi:hypothetical protein